jgi:hypothetical protein
MWPRCGTHIHAAPCPTATTCSSSPRRCAGCCARAEEAEAEARRRAEAAELALGDAGEELQEWRAGNVRVATYKKWKEENDRRRAERDGLPWPPEAEVEAKVMEAMAKGSQALGKEPSTPKIKRLNRVNTVALGMK